MKNQTDIYNIPTLLDTGCLPVEDLAVLAFREGQRPRPIYQIHKWFARRFGSAFRALMTAASSTTEAEFWPNYYQGVDWRGKTVLDPFVGGGTSIIEALRLGADVIGVDVDVVACAITRFETRLHQLPDLAPTLETIKREIGQQLAPYYRTVIEDCEARDVLHYFWVQIVECHYCGNIVEAHPHYQLAYEAEGTKQWIFCPECHQIKQLDKTETHLHCERCNLTSLIEQGTVDYGKLTCPHCGKQERLIDVAVRTGQSPKWRLFALETLEPPFNKRTLPTSQRIFRPATEHDRKVLEDVQQALRKREKANGSLAWIPERVIPSEGRADSRPLSYGYRQYRELFNPRQLLHLSHLAQAIHQLPESTREAMAIAFSDHLTTNCMMTHYAFGWRRLAPLFSVRAYRHVTRPVEVNPWLDGTGRGTFPNTVRKIQNAVNWMNSPKEPLVSGGFRNVEVKTNDLSNPNQPSVSILHRNSKDLSLLKDSSVDLVLTDPPYFDNIAYSELSDFFLPWLQLFGLVPTNDESGLGFRENLAAKNREDKALFAFQDSLRICFAEITRVLKPDGRLIFTFQHQTAKAWAALAEAINGVGLLPIQLFPLLGDSAQGLHKHTGNSKWDAVFVMVKSTDTKCESGLSLANDILQASQDHYFMWVNRLKILPTNGFERADCYNFYRACLVAGALGMFQSSNIDSRLKPLKELLGGTPP